MAKLRKTLATVGTHQSPDGPVTVTPERIDHWIGQHAAMKAAGLNVPAPWGHQKVAKPGFLDDADFRAYLSSAYNAGTLEALEKDATGNQLIGVIDAPAATLAGESLVNPATGAAVQEISVGIDDLTDGQGKTWKDVLVHAALGPWPVIAGMGGFQALSKSHEPTAAYRRLAGPPMPPKAEAKSEKAEPALETPAPESGDLLAPNAGTEVQALQKQIRETMATMNVALPEVLDTADPKSFLEHLLTAMHVIKGRMDAAPPVSAAPPQSPTAAATAETPSPLYMSLRDYEKAPAPVRRLIDQTHTKLRDELTAKIDQLAALGMPPAEVASFKSRAARANLSLRTMALDPELPAEVERMYRVLAALPAAARSHLKSAAEVPNPVAADDAAGTEKHAAYIEDRLNRMYPGRKAKLAEKNGKS